MDRGPGLAGPARRRRPAQPRHPAQRLSQTRNDPDRRPPGLARAALAVQHRRRGRTRAAPLALRRLHPRARGKRSKNPITASTAPTSSAASAP
jgi:hypothetical protein